MESESKKTTTTTNTNVIGIKQLKMMIKTGIPGKPEYTLFNSKLLSIKSKSKPFAEFPFYSDTHLYPNTKLQNSTYERIIEFFFNKEDFLKTIRNKPQDNVKELTPEQIKIENFELTLRLLFPTTFPLVNNIYNSVEYIIPSKKIFTLKGSNVFSILPKRFDRKYSYLNIDSEIYTITKTVWNNDVMNHPVYSQFIQSYKEFDIWKSDPSLNIFKQDATIDNMNIILSYVFEAVQKSEEEQLFKKMYDDSDPTKAPYYNSSGNKRLDENTLAIQDFDNAIDELMRKDEESLKKEIAAYDTEYNKLYTDLSGSLASGYTFNIELKQIQTEHDSVLFSGFFTKDKDTNTTNFKTKITSKISDISKKTEYIDKLNEIITILELIQKKKEYINNLKTKKKKSSELSDYYVYLQKYEPDKKAEIKKKFLDKEHKYKLNLINLLGKLTSVKRDNYHNVSPDFSNLIDYLKTNITDFNNKRRINTFIKDLNIKFLSDPNYKKELEKIKTIYVEFYNLALVINGLKGRKIDNPIWRDAIFKMMNGSLEENYFNNKIWEPLQDCYHLENQNPNDTNKKSRKKCDPDVITVGLDMIPIDESNNNNSNTTTTNTRKSNIPTIEIYLQMDMIEGKVDDSNVSKIKCAYDDEFLGSMFRDLINTRKQKNNFPTEQVLKKKKKMLSEINEKKGGKTKKKIKNKKKTKSRKTKKYFRR